jgi:hypothetical protein
MFPDPTDVINKSVTPFKKNAKSIQIEIPLQGDYMFDFVVECHPVWLSFEKDTHHIDLALNQLESISLVINETEIYRQKVVHNLVKTTNLKSIYEIHIPLKGAIFSGCLWRSKMVAVLEFRGDPVGPWWINYKVGYLNGADSQRMRETLVETPFGVCFGGGFISNSPQMF